MALSRKLIFITGMIAIAAAFLGAVADVLMLYSETGNYESGDYQFFNTISNSRIIAGTLLGMLAIPFEIAGLWLVYKLLESDNNKLAGLALISGLLFAILGVGVHGLLGITGISVNYLSVGMSSDLAEGFIQAISSLLNTISGLCVFFHVLTTIFFTVLFSSRKSPFSKLLVWLNPVTLYVIIVSPYFFLPEIGNILAPAAFNLSYLVFFILVLRESRLIFKTAN